MKPVNFKEQTIIIAKDQPEYLPLPAWVDPDGNETISCWKISMIERVKILFFGTLWLRQYRFKQALQPILPQVEYPFRKE